MTEGIKHLFWRFKWHKLFIGSHELKEGIQVAFKASAVLDLFHFRTDALYFT